MQDGIHPATQTGNFVCSCGAKYAIGNSTITDIHIEVCAACHPFYTGKQKLVDTAGRVDKFLQKEKVAAGKK